ITEPPAAVPVAAEPQAAAAIEEPVAPRVEAPAGERLSPTVALPPPRRGFAGLGCLVLIVVIAAAIASVVLARDQIAAAWPPAERFYNLLGIKITAKYTEWLEITKPSPTRKEERLVIEADIRNRSNYTRKLPKLRVSILDAGDKELSFNVFDPP